jgi:FtsZ-binding cell division protein ZapB
MCFFNGSNYKGLLNMYNDIFEKASGLNETLKALNNQFTADMKAWQDHSSEACGKMNCAWLEK